MSVKRRVLFGILYLFTGLILCIGYGIYYFFYSLNHLPKGELLDTYQSPTGEYSMQMYRTDGGATTSFSIRGELVHNEQGDRKNIYWQYRVDHANVYWLDEYHVKINGVDLNVRKDNYDWRRE